MAWGRVAFEMTCLVEAIPGTERLSLESFEQLFQFAEEGKRCNFVNWPVLKSYKLQFTNYKLPTSERG